VRFDLQCEIEAEADAASEKYGAFASTHEAFGVLAEEMSELLDAIRANNLESVRAEAIQVSAVAMRLAECCRGISAFAARSGA
jgi:NTP pyrophosphatase (non-canonical NTP hydrolase)